MFISGQLQTVFSSSKYVGIHGQRAYVALLAQSSESVFKRLHILSEKWLVTIHSDSLFTVEHMFVISQTCTL